MENWFDLWMVSGDNACRFDPDKASSEVTITVPGSARDVICVGAVERDNSNNVWEKSSQGPTWNKAEKPDVAAPGIGRIGYETHQKDDGTGRHRDGPKARSVSNAF